MYINSISLENIRTFAAKNPIHFNHPDRVYGEDKPLKKAPKLNNVNLLFGENSTGKTTILETIALASLGPAVIESRIDPKPLVRLIPSQRKPSKREESEVGKIKAFFTLHEGEVDSEALPSSSGFSSELRISKRGKLENIEHVHNQNINWNQVYVDENAAFFVVAYGTTRRSGFGNENSAKLRSRNTFWRTERINSIVREVDTLIDFWEWFLNQKSISNRNNEQIIGLINTVLGRGKFKFEGKSNGEDCLFYRGGMEIPLRSLSDGYRAFLSWVTDLLFHLNYTSEWANRRIDEISGIVLVDEIDLHLHPSWQMEVISKLSKTFPRLQFIFTSHSPLIAGSVEWMNITRLYLDKQHRTGIDPYVESVHGLDADQILVSELFGLTSTRAKSKENQLAKLTRLARLGDEQAAKDLILELARGTEEQA